MSLAVLDKREQTSLFYDYCSFPGDWIIAAKRHSRSSHHSTYGSSAQTAHNCQQSCEQHQIKRWWLNKKKNYHYLGNYKGARCWRISTEAKPAIGYILSHYQVSNLNSQEEAAFISFTPRAKALVYKTKADIYLNGTTV